MGQKLEHRKKRVAAKPSVIVFAAMLSVAAVVYIFRDSFCVGSRSARDAWKECPDIRRPRYPLRHLTWSGIWPWGNFVPDPHFLCSRPIELHPNVRQLLGVTTGAVQLVDINPFFRDKSSEVVLVITAGEEMSEITVNGLERTRTVLSRDEEPAAEVFLHTEHELLVWLEAITPDGPSTGFVIVPMPLLKKSDLEWIPMKSPDARRLKASLAGLLVDTSWTERICMRRLRPLHEFLEATAAIRCG